MSEHLFWNPDRTKFVFAATKPEGWDDAEWDKELNKMISRIQVHMTLDGKPVYPADMEDFDVVRTVDQNWTDEKAKSV